MVKPCFFAFGDELPLLLDLVVVADEGDDAEVAVDD